MYSSGLDKLLFKYEYFKNVPISEKDKGKQTQKWRKQPSAFSAWSHSIHLLHGVTFQKAVTNICN